MGYKHRTEHKDCTHRTGHMRHIHRRKDYTRRTDCMDWRRHKDYRGCMDYRGCRPPHRDCTGYTRRKGYMKRG